MNCDICKQPYYVPGTAVSFENVADLYLNRNFNVCPKCAYALVDKIKELSVDPATTFDDVVQREG